MVRASPDHSTLVTSDHDTITVFRGPGADSTLEEFTAEAPVKRKMVAAGDNIEAGDYFPSGSCDVLHALRAPQRLPAHRAVTPNG